MTPGVAAAEAKQQSEHDSAASASAHTGPAEFMRCRTKSSLVAVSCLEPNEVYGVEWAGASAVLSCFDCHMTSTTAA